MNIPAWVREVRDAAAAEHGKGLTVKMIGNKYYIYKRTSKRVKGMRHPQVSEACIGVATREGLAAATEREPQKETVDVHEYGFSTALLQLCPESWSRPLKDDWKAVFLEIVSKESPGSYLLADGKPPVPEGRNIPLQTRKLWGSLPEGMRERLAPLRLVYRVSIGGNVLVSTVTEEQESLARELGVSLRGGQAS